MYDLYKYNTQDVTIAMMLSRFLAGGGLRPYGPEEFTRKESDMRKIWTIRALAPFGADIDTDQISDRLTYYLPPGYLVYSVKQDGPILYISIFQ